MRASLSHDDLWLMIDDWWLYLLQRQYCPIAPLSKGRRHVGKSLRRNAASHSSQVKDHHSQRSSLSSSQKHHHHHNHLRIILIILILKIIIIIGRVVVPDDGEDSVAARQSLAFFVQPDDDVQWVTFWLQINLASQCANINLAIEGVKINFKMCKINFERSKIDVISEGADLWTGPVQNTHQLQQGSISRRGQMFYQEKQDYPRFCDKPLQWISFSLVENYWASSSIEQTERSKIEALLLLLVEKEFKM